MVWSRMGYPLTMLWSFNTIISHLVERVSRDVHHQESHVCHYPNQE